MASDEAKNRSAAGAAHCIVLFDGVCSFCNGWVQFLIKRDQRDVFRFAALQSDFAQSLLAAHGVESGEMNSVVAVEGTKLFDKSGAVLHIFKRLGGMWKLLFIFSVVPRPVRDAVYLWIARRRYQWFGKYDSCMLPTDSMKRKFID
ncbi:thiol-disulfide oxidoreductase DCC family protein [Paenibacillus xerothermodurans]|uniref:Thiol-disulfide oxidoreductase DCC family protein n=1 Tax=Paenibacillus xerothermodurans TaxID=1977292 RepID=A0A2W1N3V1_PAEXE|nr:thiol-disulfide oxidoreductase DCC family protein [Paenibacillus xerothermodurans]PZE19419.1 thiol-disulfide oxidoreductase DCC family protein [Paenibacillus xerothermodurans]